MADSYTAKYEWPMRPRDGALYDDHGNTGGEGFTATRWRFRGV